MNQDFKTYDRDSRSKEINLRKKQEYNDEKDSEEDQQDDQPNR